MRIPLRKAGNSYTVQIPIAFVKEAGLGRSAHLLVEGSNIILRRYKNPRFGWAKAMREAVRNYGNEFSSDDVEWLNAPMGPLPTAPRPKQPAQGGTRRKRSS